jgi:hypothetical protein
VVQQDAQLGHADNTGPALLLALRGAPAQILLSQQEVIPPGIVEFFASMNSNPVPKLYGGIFLR